MLPSRIDAMVVVVVHASEMVRNIHRMVVIVRTALVLSIEIFEDDVTQPSAIFQVDFRTEHDVLEFVAIETALLVFHPLITLTISIVVEEEELTMILEIMVAIDTQAPRIGIIIDAEHPTTERVTSHIGIHAVGGIGSTRDEGIPHTLESTLCRHLLHLVTHHTVGFAAKLIRHLQSHFETQRTEGILIAYLEVSCLAMVEYMVGIFRLALRELMLPIIVGHHTIGDVTLDMQPMVEDRNRPILRQRQSHLWHRSCIDTKCLATTGECLVFQFHRILLSTSGEHTMKPSCLHESLLHHHMAGIIDRHGNVHAISHSPPTSRVGG